MSHTMYLIEKEELLDLLSAWHRFECSKNWADKKGFLLEWCEENQVEYNENFTFEDIAHHELKNYEETELAWET